MAHAKQAITTISTAAGISLFDQLSPELLQEVLQRVPQRERLQQCGRVSNAFSAAASLATTEVECDASTEDAAEALGRWLTRHAGHIKRVVVRQPTGTARLRLPWVLYAQLQSLDLSNCRLPALTLPGGSGSSNTGGPSAPGVSAASFMTPHLTKLWLSDCTFDTLDSLPLLVSIPPALAVLCMGSLRFGDASYYDAKQRVRIRTVVSNTLEHLDGLSELLLPGKWVTLTPAGLKHVAAMTGLSAVQMGPLEDAAWHSTAHLPSSLTSLCLFHGTEPGDFSYDDDDFKPHPDLQHLSRLSLLHLEYCVLSGMLVGSMTQLTFLKLVNVLCTVGADELLTPSLELLRAVQQLTQLQHLHVEGDRLVVPADSLQLYAALTASTQLTYLVVCADEGPPLPADAVRHVFPAGKQLPQLRVLTVKDYNTPYLDDAGQPVVCLGSEHLSSIISCCPSLEALFVCEHGRVMYSDAHIAALQRLPSDCRILTVWGCQGAAFSDATAAAVARLTHLTKLSFFKCPALTDRGVEHLTALPRLYDLAVSGCTGLSLELIAAADGATDDGSFALDWRGESVSKRLCEACDRSPVCAVGRLQQQKAENAELRVEKKCLQFQVQAHLLQVQQQASEISNLRQQLAASQAELQGWREKPDVRQAQVWAQRAENLQAYEQNRPQQHAASQAQESMWQARR